jgi:hypothetical protein
VQDALRQQSWHCTDERFERFEKMRSPVFFSALGNSASRTKLRTRARTMQLTFAAPR